jgi:hypothetical protein
VTRCLAGTYQQYTLPTITVGHQQLELIPFSNTVFNTVLHFFNWGNPLPLSSWCDVRHCLQRIVDDKVELVRVLYVTLVEYIAELLRSLRSSEYGITEVVCYA